MAARNLGVRVSPHVQGLRGSLHRDKRLHAHRAQGRSLRFCGAGLGRCLYAGLYSGEESGKGAPASATCGQIGLALPSLTWHETIINSCDALQSWTTTNICPSPGPRDIRSNWEYCVRFCPSDTWPERPTKPAPHWADVFRTEPAVQLIPEQFAKPEDADHSTRFGMKMRIRIRFRWCFEQRSVHAARGAKKGVNYLMPTGHIRNVLAIEWTIQPVIEDD